MLYTLSGIVDKQSSRASMAEQCRCHDIFSKVLYLEWRGESWLDWSVNLFCTWIMSCFLKVSIAILARVDLNVARRTHFRITVESCFAVCSSSSIQNGLPSCLTLASWPPSWLVFSNKRYEHTSPRSWTSCVSWNGSSFTMADVRGRCHFHFFSTQ